jgi:hypothetical protein
VRERERKKEKEREMERDGGRERESAPRNKIHVIKVTTIMANKFVQILTPAKMQNFHSFLGKML